jgi:hypothetical protein
MRLEKKEDEFTSWLFHLSLCHLEFSWMTICISLHNASLLNVLVPVFVFPFEVLCSLLSTVLHTDLFLISLAVVVLISCILILFT